jgi:hypothetical protein
MSIETNADGEIRLRHRFRRELRIGVTLLVIDFSPALADLMPGRHHEKHIDKTLDPLARAIWIRDTVYGVPTEYSTTPGWLAPDDVLKVGRRYAQHEREQIVWRPEMPARSVSKYLRRLADFEDWIAEVARHVEVAT